MKVALSRGQESQRGFHRSDFPSVMNTVRADVQLKSYDTYFDFLVDLAGGLETLWNE